VIILFGVFQSFQPGSRHPKILNISILYHFVQTSYQAFHIGHAVMSFNEHIKWFGIAYYNKIVCQKKIGLK
jgi:hypothetical protein